MNCVYIGSETNGPIFGGVLEWRGDVLNRCTGRGMRRVHSDYNDGRDWFVSPDDAPFYAAMPVCPECTGERCVPIVCEVNYGPHPDSPEYGDYIVYNEELAECPACRGTGIEINWTWDMRTQFEEMALW